MTVNGSEPRRVAQAGVVPGRFRTRVQVGALTRFFLRILSICEPRAEQWRWSSLRHCAYGETGPVSINEAFPESALGKCSCAGINTHG